MISSSDECVLCLHCLFPQPPTLVATKTIPTYTWQSKLPAPNAVQSEPGDPQLCPYLTTSDFMYVLWFRYKDQSSNMTHFSYILKAQSHIFGGFVWFFITGYSTFLWALWSESEAALINSENVIRSSWRKWRMSKLWK